MAAYSFPKRAGLEAIRKHLVDSAGFSGKDAERASLPIYDELAGKKLAYWDTGGKDFLQHIRLKAGKAKRLLKDRGELGGLEVFTGQGTKFLTTPGKVFEEQALELVKKRYNRDFGRELKGRKTVAAHSSRTFQPLIEKGWVEYKGGEIHTTEKGSEQFAHLWHILRRLDWQHRNGMRQ
ncbi:MAG: hypothetical protein WC792_01975 [Candidatus Micrarchaeia archaeon]|jgi:hypothetical protein